MKLELPNLQQNIELAPFTTYKIGGPADYFVAVHNPDQLCQAILQARKLGLPYFLLGTGANILIGDKGFRGLVIYNQANNVSFAPNKVMAESGATIANLIQLCAQQNLSGLEHFAGIPSSVGGALWQNLHFLSPDRTRTIFIAEIVHSARVLMPDNAITDVGVDFFNFGYDESILHHKEIIVLSAIFNLMPQDQAEIEAQIKANLVWRRERQPQLADSPSCGSVFKKIDGVGAGRLIDQVGLKGKIIGGAQISPLHANFLVNIGGATAADVMALAKLAQEKVKAETGYELEMEIGLVGEF
jgi:UDP-N-acetylmuramate dehydrogenase